VGKSFLDRVQPNRQRWKLVAWPFPVEGEAPKLKVRVLGQNEAEAAYLGTIDHFKGRKPEIKFTDPLFVARERAEVVWRSYTDTDGEPIAEDVDELTKQPLAIIDELHTTWSQFQSDVAAPVPSAKEMDALVEGLKKNIPAGLLSGLPSTWLIGLITTLASQLAPSTTASGDG
jgi:hypothetical protein